MYTNNKLYLLIIFCILSLTIGSCSHPYIKSGKYVLLRDGDSLNSLMKEFNIPYEELFNANKKLKWQRGEWVFIPQKIGFLPGLISSLTNSGDALYSNSNYYDGYFLWPTPTSNKLTSTFGEDRGNHDHDGLDIAAPIGTYIVAVEDGEISISNDDPAGYGELLMISHDNNISTLYGHLSKKLARPGDKVKKGQIIALVGNTGRSSGPHLHFEVRKSGKAIDPTQFFSTK